MFWLIIYSIFWLANKFTEINTHASETNVDSKSQQSWIGFGIIPQAKAPHIFEVIHQCMFKNSNYFFFWGGGGKRQNPVFVPFFGYTDSSAANTCVRDLVYVCDKRKFIIDRRKARRELRRSGSTVWLVDTVTLKWSQCPQNCRVRVKIDVTGGWARLHDSSPSPISSLYTDK